MLYETLKFLSERLNQLWKAGGPAGGESLLEWGNIAQLELLGPNDDTLEDRIVLTLVNLEEEKTLRNGQSTTTTSQGKIVHLPPIHLNLYLLFSMRFSSYDAALKNLSNVLLFFQQRPVFDVANTPGMPPGVEKLVFDLVTMSFEQQNQLWVILGSKHYPSALYKMRLVQVLELPVEEAPLIKRITSNENNVVR